MEEIYRLRYDCYLAEGAIEPTDRAQFFDDFDEYPNCFHFGIRFEGRLVSAIRLHVCSPEYRAGPGLSVYPETLGPIVDRSESFIDPTRFVVDASIRRATPFMPFATLRLAAMAADHFDTTQILATVRIEHVPFYRRIFGLAPLTKPRAYPTLTKPICLMANYTDVIREEVYARYPVFSSDPGERIALFGPSRSRDFLHFGAPSANDNAGRNFYRRGEVRPAANRRGEETVVTPDLAPR